MSDICPFCLKLFKNSRSLSTHKSIYHKQTTNEPVSDENLTEELLNSDEPSSGSDTEFDKDISNTDSNSDLSTADSDTDSSVADSDTIKSIVKTLPKGYCLAVGKVVSELPSVLKITNPNLITNGVSKSFLFPEL